MKNMGGSQREVAGKCFKPVGDWLAALDGRVSEGVLVRVMEVGAIPERGPGRYSVPNALEAIKEEERGGNRGPKQGGPPRGTKRRHFGGR